VAESRLEIPNRNGSRIAAARCQRYSSGAAGWHAQHAEQQIVEIAKAVGARAKVMILDEPTASLTGREVESLFQVIATLRGHGVGIIYTPTVWRKSPPSRTASRFCATVTQSPRCV